MVSRFPLTPARLLRWLGPCTPLTCSEPYDYGNIDIEKSRWAIRMKTITYSCVICPNNKNLLVWYFDFYGLRSR